MGKVIYAGSFDPITFGHINILKRAASVFEELTVGLGVNPDKKYLFSLEEKMEMVRRALAAFPDINSKINLVSFQGLLVDYAREHQIPLMIKGLRDENDLTYEFTIFRVAESQKPRVDTFFIPARQDMLHISSSSSKALQAEQGLVHEYVPLYVKQCLEGRISGQYIIGVTGEICAGKSYICNLFQELGEKHGIPIHHLELDFIPHRIYDGTYSEPLYASIRSQIIKTFGQHVGFPDGTINRKNLGEIVFNDPQKLEQLSKIVSEPLRVRLRREMYRKKGLILINAALLVESEMLYLSNNNIVLVTTDKFSQERRLQARNLSQSQINRRLASQYNEADKRKKIEMTIQKHNQGTLWSLDNSDRSNPSEISSLFDNIITDIDQYGELRFRGLWERIRADGTPDQEYNQLITSYTQGYRSYHSLSHIVSGLNEHTDASMLIEHPDQVLFAWWYHDLVQERLSKVDEEKSAQTAYNVCKNALLTDEFAENVKNLILTTKHIDPPITNDEKFMVDIDLSIFGQSIQEFDKYEDGIRSEYHWVNPEVFRTGRLAVLQGFIDRSYIYNTEFYRQKYETQARINLERSISQLKQ